MHHVVSVLAYGDSLITLSLLERMPKHGPVWQVIGSRLTAEVSQLLRTPVPTIQILEQRAAFYAIKEYGWRKAIMDFFTTRHSLSRLTSRGDVVAFERADLRTTMLRPNGRFMVCPPKTQQVYVDRRDWLKHWSGVDLDWPPAVRPVGSVRQVLLNPCARFGNRFLDSRIVENIIGIGDDLGWTITILDPCRRYQDFVGRVAVYHQALPLVEAAAKLRSTDLFIGPDSFFIHLAYYYAVPCFGFFFSHYHDFMLPGMAQMQNFLDFDSALDRWQLETRLLRFVEQSSKAAVG